MEQPALPSKFPDLQHRIDQLQQARLHPEPPLPMDPVLGFQRWARHVDVKMDLADVKVDLEYLFCLALYWELCKRDSFFVQVLV
jgi:hypothetical protein